VPGVVGEMGRLGRYYLSELPVGSIYAAREMVDRCDDGDLVEAEAAIERLAAARADDSYRALANSLGFERHMRWAAAMA
jgi:hypothetical protein